MRENNKTIAILIGWIAIIFMCGMILGVVIRDKAVEGGYVETSCLVYECEKCSKCIECADITFYECGKCPKTYEQELANCVIMRDNYDDLYNKFQQLDMVTTTTAGIWKFNETRGEDRYVCYDYSNDFMKKWKKMGYDGTMIFGSTPQGRARGSVGHTWVAIYIDAVTGEFVKVADGYELEDRDYYLK